MSEFLPCIIIEPPKTANASIIWLHGLGADGHDFEGIVPQLRLPEAMAVRFVLPSAGSIPITINNGHVMPAWFDILEPGKERSINPHQLLAAATAVHALIDREIEKGMPSDRIMLAGFSQGGAVTFQAGLTYDQPLAGIIGLSTFFPTADAIKPHPANHGVPIQVFHGTQDPVLPIEMAQNTVKYLKELGYRPQYKTYPMVHTVSADEIDDISNWFQSILL